MSAPRIAAARVSRKAEEAALRQGVAFDDSVARAARSAARAAARKADDAARRAARYEINVEGMEY